MSGLFVLNSRLIIKIEVWFLCEDSSHLLYEYFVRRYWLKIHFGVILDVYFGTARNGGETAATAENRHHP